MQEYLIAFAVGGTICALSQLRMDKTKLMPGRIMVILVVTGVVLGAGMILFHFYSYCHRFSIAVLVNALLHAFR